MSQSRRDVEPFYQGGSHPEARRTRPGGLTRAGHFLVVAAVAVVAAVVAFSVLSFLVGALVEMVKVAVVVALVAGAYWVFSRRRR